MTARTVFEKTRSCSWPAPEGTRVTVRARLDDDTIGLHWERDDLKAKGSPGTTLALTPAEFDGIARALGYTRRKG